jgi:hypothetical protein
LPPEEVCADHTIISRAMSVRCSFMIACNESFPRLPSYPMAWFLPIA